MLHCFELFCLFRLGPSLLYVHYTIRSFYGQSHFFLFLRIWKLFTIQIYCDIIKTNTNCDMM